MIVAVGCDHAGFPLKKRVIREVKMAGHEVLDCGAFDTRPSDYPDFARKVGQAVRRGGAGRGILVCGSGVGAAIAASKLPGIRAGLCTECFTARQGVEDDDMNVLCLGARATGPEVAAEAVRAFLAAVFSGAARHRRRLRKVAALERFAAVAARRPARRQR